MLQKNNLNTKQTVKKWAYSEYTEKFIVFLAKSRESMIKIMNAIQNTLLDNSEHGSP